MKHTPGPWKVRDIHRVTDSNGQGVALMVTRYSQFEAYANARLIAAAPDLLAACQKIVAWDKSTGGDLFAEWTGILGEAKTAIALCQYPNTESPDG